MSHYGHEYKDKVRGRSFIRNPTTGRSAAHVTCSKCGGGASFNCNRLPPSEIVDKKFTARGWELDPIVCPPCLDKKRAAKPAHTETPKNTDNHKEQEEMQTAALAANDALKAISSDMHKANAKMHQMLVIHFDADAGKYADGWNDERVAKESGVALSHVAEIRALAYGELKEPEEVTALRNDIKALNELITETLIAAQKEVNSLNNRVAEITKKLGVKL